MLNFPQINECHGISLMAKQHWFRLYLGAHKQQATTWYWPSYMAPYSDTWGQYVNPSPPGQNGRLFADDIFGRIHVNEKFCILIKKITEVCSYGSNWQQPSVGLDNGLAPNRRQAIIRTNADPTNWRLHAVLWGDLRESLMRIKCVSEKWNVTGWISSHATDIILASRPTCNRFQLHVFEVLLVIVL